MKTILIFLSGMILLAGCSKDVIEPELYGSIEGSVTDSKTGNGVSGVSIETTPATESITTDEQGNFELQNVATGSYLIKASKSTYESKSVNVQVQEDQTTPADIVMEGGENTSENLQAEVRRWNQSGPPDTSQVKVYYRLENTSSTKTFKDFEVYFDIYTNQETLIGEVADTSLHPDTELDPSEMSTGSFTKPVQDRVVDSVVVSGHWIKKEKVVGQ